MRSDYTRRLRVLFGKGGGIPKIENTPSQRGEAIAGRIWGGIVEMKSVGMGPTHILISRTEYADILAWLAQKPHCQYQIGTPSSFWDLELCITEDGPIEVRSYLDDRWVDGVGIVTQFF